MYSAIASSYIYCSLSSWKLFGTNCARNHGQGIYGLELSNSCIVSRELVPISMQLRPWILQSPTFARVETFGLTVASSVEPAVDSEMRLQRPALKPFVNSGVIGDLPLPTWPRDMYIRGISVYGCGKANNMIGLEPTSF
jgi:hypothetical protein